ncbi:MAG TPA: hypothetical protein VKG25_21055 [Bryobacteraceae bacterium]|nr:hypothetical protein [Bryobacteraceae bacterium]
MNCRVTHLGKSLALLGFAVCSGSLSAANLLSPVPATAVALYCGNAATATVTVKPVSGTATIVITLATPLPNGLVVSPTTQTLNAGNSAAGVTFTLSAPTCAGVAAGANAFTLTLKAGGVNDATVAGTINAAALTASPASLTMTCAYDGVSKYVSSSPQTVTVGSSASATFAGISNAGALIITNNPTPVALTSSTTAAFSVAAPSTASSGTCAAGSTTLGLGVGAGATEVFKVIPVTITSVPFTPLTTSPAAPTLAFTIGSGIPASVTVTINSTKIPAAFFSVDTTTLPSYLTVNAISGTVNGRNTLTFSTTGVADTLTPGVQNPAHVHLKVSGYGDLDLAITLTVSNPSAVLSVVEGTNRNLSWAIGSAIPTPVITVTSSGTAIPYTLSTIAGQLSPSVTPESGLAYGFGTAIPVTFSPQAFAAAQPGNILNGAVVITWGGSKTITVNFNVTVTFTSSTASLNSISPTTLPTAGSGQTFTVSLFGNGFVPSTDPTQQTIAGIVKTTAGVNAIVADANVTAVVANASVIVLTITNPATADTNLPFATANSIVKFGVCNPQGASACTVPTGIVSLTIGAGPTITSAGIVSASTFLPVTSTVAPYDILSIFGSNFCTANGTGCAPGQLLYGIPTAPNLTYPTFLTPDANGTGAAPRQLTVTFSKTGQTSINAPLLFATNSQINLLVPSGVTAFGGSGNITVNFGAASSTAVPITITATDPGIFTVNSAGSGDGAILDLNYNLISNTNPASIRVGPTTSDIIQVYASGLGVPVDGTGTCITLAAYEALLSPSPATIDGVVLQSSLLTGAGDLPPCLATTPTSKIGNVTSVALGSPYAGFVSGAVAGLYQVNLRLPNNGSVTFKDAAGQSHTTGVLGPLQVPVLVGTSQANVSMWVVPQLDLVAPTALTGTNGSAWAGASNVITGTATAFTAVPSFMLPTAVTIDTTGTIAGTPTSNGYYVVTANGTDASTPPVTGPVTFTLNVAAAASPSPVTLAASTLTPTTYPAANAGVTTITPGGGVAPYTFTVSPSVGLTITTNSSGNGVISTPASLAAGTYEVTVTATDSTTGTALTNTIQFPLTVALALTSSNGESVKGTAGQANTLTTIQATGQTGTVTYALLNKPQAWFSIDGSTGIVSTSSSAAAGTYYLTVTAADGTAAANTSANGAGTIYVAVTIQ